MMHPVHAIWLFIVAWLFTAAVTVAPLVSALPAR